MKLFLIAVCVPVFYEKIGSKLKCIVTIFVKNGLGVAHATTMLNIYAKANNVQDGEYLFFKHYLNIDTGVIKVNFEEIRKSRLKSSRIGTITI